MPSRFTTRPEAGEFQEHLAYTFESPGPAGVTLTLHWEKVAVPIPIIIDTPAVVSDNLQQQLHNLPGFFWQSFAQAASWSARNNANLDRAAAWADRAIAMNRNYQTLRAKALVLERKGEYCRGGRLARGGDEGRDGSRHQRLRLRADRAPERWTTPSRSSARTSRITRARGTPMTASGEALALKGQTAEAVAQYTKALQDGRRRHEQEPDSRDPGKAGRELEVASAWAVAGASRQRLTMSRFLHLQSVAAPSIAIRRNPGQRWPGR